MNQRNHPGQSRNENHRDQRQPRYFDREDSGRNNGGGYYGREYDRGYEQDFSRSSRQEFGGREGWHPDFDQNRIWSAGNPDRDTGRYGDQYFASRNYASDYDQGRRQYGQGQYSPARGRHVQDGEWQYEQPYDQSRYGRGQYEQGPYGRGQYGQPADQWQYGSQPYGNPPGYYEQQANQYGPHVGKGPKGYQRSPERMKEKVCDRLERDGYLDASEIEVNVSNGEVTLSGKVASREEKRAAEQCVESIHGVKDVHNQLKVDSNLSTSAHSDQRSADSTRASEKTGGKSKSTNIM